MFSPQKLLLLFKKNQRKLVKLHDHFKKIWACHHQHYFSKKKKFVKLISRKIIIHQCMNNHKILMVSIITKTTTIPMRTTSYTSNGIFSPKKIMLLYSVYKFQLFLCILKNYHHINLKKKWLMQDLLNWKKKTLDKKS